MFTTAVNPDGSITAEEVPNPAVYPKLHREILHLKAEHCTNDDLITHLKCTRGIRLSYRYQVCDNSM